MKKSRWRTAICACACRRMGQRCADCGGKGRTGSGATSSRATRARKSKVGGQGDVLIPFPGRVRDGRYTFEGQTYQMPINDKDGPNAIHGFVRLIPWEVAEQFEGLGYDVVLNPKTEAVAA